MKEDLIFQELKRLAKKKNILPEQNLYKDLGLNSLDVTEIVIFLEENFQVLPDFEALQTVNDVILSSKMPLWQKARMEKEKMPSRWQKERKESLLFPSETLQEAFLRSADRMGASLACVDQTVISYDILKSRSIGLAKIFSEFPEKRIGLALPSSILLIEVLFGLLLAKKIPVFLNWTLGPLLLKEMASLAKVNLILTNRYLEEHFKGMETKILPLESLRKILNYAKRREAVSLARRSSEYLIEHFDLKDSSPKDPALIFFTSGSEKKPKGVTLSHENILINERDAVKACPLSKEDTVLGMLPSFHVFGLSTGVLIPLLFGVKVVLPLNPLDMKIMIELIQKWQVTVLFTTPTFFEALLSTSLKEQLSSLRRVILGAEKTPVRLFEQVEKKFPHITVVEGYGLTECSPVVTLNRSDSPRAGVGYPLEHIRLDIMDPETKLPAKKGEVLVSGPNVFSGYLEPESDTFIEFDQRKWFRTKDLGYLEKGALHLMGRLSRTIKRGGEMLSLSLIEEAVKGAVIEKEGKLILFTTTQLTLDEANKLLQEKGLSNLFRLDEVKKIPSMPLLANGKIDYLKLKSNPNF